MALGLFIPPLWIGNVEDKEAIAMPGLMFFYFFTAAVVVALFVFLFPKEEPVGLTIRVTVPKVSRLLRFSAYSKTFSWTEIIEILCTSLYGGVS